MPRFRLVSPKVWKIDGTLSHARRARLFGAILFPEIVEMICRKARLAKITLEKGSKKKRGFHRWVVTLLVDPSTVDLWHNSPGGYRAQYYIDPVIGDAANACALKAIRHVVETLIDQERLSVVRKSIYSQHTRLWIGQGVWFRQCMIRDRLLHVSRWQDHQTQSKDAAKLVRWGMLLPENEPRLVLKGQWLNADGSATSEPPKPTRARQINQYGYT